MRNGEVRDHPEYPEQDFPVVIAALPPTPLQRRIAFGVVVALLCVAAAIAPFAQAQAPRVDAFIPVVQTVLSIADLTTATLLFVQHSVRPQRALLALGAGYIFSGSFAFLQTLSFPGAYAPAGVIGDGFNSPAVLFVLWHTTFPLAVLVYALSKDDKPIAPEQWSTAIEIVIAVAGTVALIAGLTWIATAGVEHLPRFYTENVTLQTRFANRINIALWTWGITVLAVLFAHRRTIIDLWLMVTLVAWMPNFLVAIFTPSVRFSVGWYAARGFALVASCMLLGVLLTEMVLLYSRLANAMTLQRRERVNRLMSVDAATAAIAHEVRTPLGAIALNANAALTQLRTAPPRLEGLGEMLEDIEAASYRAGDIISSIRELFKTTTSNRMPLDLEDVAREVLRLAQHDLHISQIAVETDFQGALPKVHADSIQLQQAILNLVRNAVDAMAFADPGARRLRLATGLDGGAAILLSVEDSGTGISPDEQGRIFDPFFTTRKAGMGLGLAISRAIVESHGGRLRLVRSDSGGSVLEIALPAGAAAARQPD